MMTNTSLSRRWLLTVGVALLCVAVARQTAAAASSDQTTAASDLAATSTEDVETTAATTRRPSIKESWNYADFPVPRTDNTSRLCLVPANFSMGVPHICDPLGFLNVTMYMELEAEIKKLHDYRPAGDTKDCAGWQVTIGLMKWLKEDDVLRLKGEFQEFGVRLLTDKWRFLEHCVTDVVILVALKDKLVTAAMSTYVHGEIPIHCRENILGEYGVVDADLLYPDTVGMALKKVLYRLREVQHDKEGALVCYRSWFLIHRSAIIAGFTIGLLFVVILWVAYCITGKCGTCAGEVPGYRRHLK